MKIVSYGSLITKQVGGLVVNTKLPKMLTDVHTLLNATRKTRLNISLFWGLGIGIMAGIAPTLFAQKAAPQNNSPILIEFANGNKVSRDEFEYVYQKNNGGLEAAKKHTPAQLKEYLDLYIKFKRKVMDAEAAGLDTAESFKAELATYLKQLAQPYMVEKDVQNALVDEAIRRSKQALKVSHILLRVDESAMPDDTLLVYKKLMAIRDSVIRLKKNFEDMALVHSEDPSAKENKGYLSYFTAFDFVYPFENAAFNTQVGQVSMPVRTKFGYHIIWVREKLDIQPNKVVSHILVRWGPSYEAKDSLQALDRITKVYDLAKKGGDFSKLAEEYSDDPNTKKRGGELGTRYLPVPELQDRRYTLGKETLSKPFLSSYGWHIIRITDPAEKKTETEIRNEIRNRVMRDGRAQIAEDKLVENLQKQYNYKVYPENIKKAASLLGDSYLNITSETEQKAQPEKDLVLVSFADQKLTLSNLIVLAAKNRRRPPVAAAETQMKVDVEQAGRMQLLEYEEKQLANKYPEYRNLMKEYRDGILLFTVTEQKVWRKAVEDTTGLKAYYEANRNKFPAGDRIRIREYRSKDSLDLVFVDSLYNSGTSFDLADTTIIKLEKPIRFNKQVFDRGSERAKRFINTPRGFRTEIYPESGGYTIQIVEEFLKPGFKSFDEARSECITLYQNKLEEEWLAALEKAYPYKLNETTFNALFK